VIEMEQDPGTVPELAEAERARQKLADTFGEPPPAPAGTPLTEADKAAVERVAEEIPRSHAPASPETEQQVSSSAGELRELSEELRETDPEAARIVKEQADQMEKLI
jgi:TolA-binding protein